MISYVVKQNGKYLYSLGIHSTPSTDDIGRANRYDTIEDAQSLAEKYPNATVVSVEMPPKL